MLPSFRRVNPSKGGEVFHPLLTAARLGEFRMSEAGWNEMLPIRTRITATFLFGTRFGDRGGSDHARRLRQPLTGAVVASAIAAARKR
jgi:hypothetical protein